MLPVRNDKWEEGGPTLSLEFSRISFTRCGALTLVIDPKNGSKVPTRFAVSARKNICDAICDLRTRESTTVDKIGYIDLVRNSSHSDSDYPEVIDIVTKWARGKGFDGVVWTDLRSNFKAEKHECFSIGSALDYLYNLLPTQAKKAREYIQKAPKEVKTRTRLWQKLQDDSWLSSHAG